MFGFGQSSPGETEEEQNELIAQIESWHENDEHQKIVDRIGSIPEEERGYKLTCILARALVNSANSDNTNSRPLLLRAEEIIRTVETDGIADPLWYYRLGVVIYYLDREEEAYELIKQSHAMDASDAEVVRIMELCEKFVKGKSDIAPVTIERVKLFFDDHEYTYDVTEDGKCVKSGFDGNPFAFTIVDDGFLGMWSAWAPDVPLELRGEVMSACNEWSNNTKFPKAYIQVKDNGVIWVCGEHFMIIRNGATTNQIISNISMFISSSLELYKYLTDRFPQVKPADNNEPEATEG